MKLDSEAKKEGTQKAPENFMGQMRREKKEREIFGNREERVRTEIEREK